MEFKICPFCKTRVIVKEDGICPSCRHNIITEIPIPADEQEPKKPSITTIGKPARIMLLGIYVIIVVPLIIFFFDRIKDTYRYGDFFLVYLDIVQIDALVITFIIGLIYMFRLKNQVLYAIIFTLLTMFIDTIFLANQINLIELLAPVLIVKIIFFIFITFAILILNSYGNKKISKNKTEKRH